MRAEGLVACAIGLAGPAVALAAPAAATAHVRSGVVAVSYRATVDRVPRALRAGVDQSDRAIRLTAARGHAVVVLGYLGEAVARIDARGLAVNDGAPTAAAFGLTKPNRRRPVGAVAWRRVSAARSVAWHDARLRGLPPGLDRGRWAVPVTLDGRRVELQGELLRVRAPTWWPWLLLGVPFAAATAILLVRGGGRREQGAVVLGGVAGLATLTAAAAFSLDRYASAGTWVESGNEAFLVIVGLFVLWTARNHAAMRYGAVAVLGSLGVLLGVTKAAVFTNGVVLAVLPAGVSRLAVALSLAAGAAALIVAASFFFGDALSGSADPDGSARPADFWSFSVDRERQPPA